MGRATGYRGVFVIPWAQTEIDHEIAGRMELLRPGACWRSLGRVLRVDGPNDLLRLDRISRIETISAAELDNQPPKKPGFILTDGLRAFSAALLDLGRLVSFRDMAPTPEATYWVVQANPQPAPRIPPGDSVHGALCFAAGTRLAAPGGPIPVEDLCPGDQVLTRDDGPQAVLWIGVRHLPLLELELRPELRPICIRAGAFGEGRPGCDLLVSPGHRILLKGAAARALYGTEEVLVVARDLVNDRSITAQPAPREASYYHVLLARHQIVWANGLECESFHPVDAAPGLLDDGQRKAMLAACPQLAQGTHAYGPPVRRCLNRAQAAILRHDAGWRH